jgi:FAD/FMN-containing dehydrogenase
MTIEQLRSRISGDVFTPEDAGYHDALAGFNLAVAHTPRVAVVVSNVDDVVRATAFARDAGMRVAVQCTGHGATAALDGLFIATGRLNAVHVNPISRSAVIGAGARWERVVNEAAKYGLMPVTGSSPHLGVVGYLLGGGLGPLARSHGFSSDYVTSFTVVTSSGETLTANASTNEALYWALRGGKSGFGIVTDVSVRLVGMKRLYAGSLLFAESDIEPVLRSWVRWTHTAHPQVTTSACIVRFPERDAIPAHLRGKRFLNVRFAFPGDKEFGAQLAAPIRAFAPALLDTIDELPAKEIGRIHNDPTDAMPVWMMGMLLDHADDDLADTLLQMFGAGTHAPFTAVELRHIGQATASDVTEGSAVAGRSASYVLCAAASDPSVFATVLPDFAQHVRQHMASWLAREGNPNFQDTAGSSEMFMRLWPSEMRERIAAVRAQHDPDGMFA